MTKLMEQLVAAATQLPAEEQDTLATFWFADVRGESISDELRVELDRRARDHDEHPEDVVTWVEVQERIRDRARA